MKKTLPILLTIFIPGFIALSLFVPSVADKTFKKQKELVKLSKEQQLIPNLSASLSAKSGEIALLKKVLPEKKDFALVAQSIDSLAAKDQVFVDLHFESENLVNDENGDAFVPVKITVEGSHENVIAFLKNLQNGPYFYIFKTIEGDSPDGIRAKNKVVIQANLYASN